MPRRLRLPRFTRVYLRPSGLRNRRQEIFRKESESFVVSKYSENTWSPTPPRAYFAPDVIQQVDRAKALRNFDSAWLTRAIHTQYISGNETSTRSTHDVSTSTRAGRGGLRCYSVLLWWWWWRPCDPSRYHFISRRFAPSDLHLLTCNPSPYEHMCGFYACIDAGRSNPWITHDVYQPRDNHEAQTVFKIKRPTTNTGSSSHLFSSQRRRLDLNRLPYRQTLFSNVENYAAFSTGHNGWFHDQLCCHQSGNQQRDDCEHFAQSAEW